MRLIGAMFLLLSLVLFSGFAAMPLPSSDERIRYYSEKVSQHPRHYPAYALLGGAYLDKARQTHNPDFLREARRNLQRSLEIQPTFHALKTMAGLCNFAHRFEEALQWARDAAEASPTDTYVVSIAVEAYLGLGRDSDAAKQFLSEDTEPSDFHIAAARGHWFESQKRFNEAAAAFSKAAAFARTQRAVELVVWAEVSAAGTLLDSGQLKRAQSHLDTAVQLDPENVYLSIHRAELLEKEGRPGEALARYEAAIRRSKDPVIHAKAFMVAHRLGHEQTWRQHFEAAERGFLEAINAQEVYTLGALARLYAAANTNLEKALALAKRNLQYKRDAEAKRTLALVRRLVRSAGVEE